ncbi:MAG: serine acetyltransferase [Prolixibacteraceae bacterium]|jgi:serine O-acetyltransferase|nr:serine acetyltransferase [Prolixibacteraceae bacterium]
MKEHMESKIRKSIGDAVQQLTDISAVGEVAHAQRAGEPMPSTEKLKIFVDKVRQIIFPGYFGPINFNPTSFHYHMGVLVDEVFHLLSEQLLAGLCFVCDKEFNSDLENRKAESERCASKFIAALPRLREVLITDVEAAYLGDPAATSRSEVIFCYPAIRAISSYRIANALHKFGIPLIPRIIAEMAHSETGIDIHPEATIGSYFAIDHGTGIVIGSTTIIGTNVKLYQGVTLGAKSFSLDASGNPVKGIPRHPIVEDNVVVYSNASILGRITIGHDSVIGGNIWITNDLPPYSKIVQNKAKTAEYIFGAGI